MHRRSRAFLVLLAAVVAALTALAVDANAQESDGGGGLLPISTTSSSTSSSSTTSTTGPDLDDGSSTPAPPGSGSQPGGDGGSPSGHIVVPPEAQRIIDSVVRTPASNNRALVDGIKPLVDLGMTEAEAIRVGFGRFPVAGPVNYGDDWLLPRYGPGFRFHLGCDVMAAYGTPLRAVVDGVLHSHTEPLGGLTLKLYMDDGTYFYYAHLSGLIEGFQEGMAVKTGDIIGYVGDSGNAKGGSPHVHFGVYPGGVAPINPKPVLDRFLFDAVSRLPQVIDYERSRRVGPETAPRQLGQVENPLRPFLATEQMRSLIAPPSVPGLPTELLFVSSANPTSGGLKLAEAEATQVAASIDWDARRAAELERAEVTSRSVDLLRLALMPFVSFAESDHIANAAISANNQR